MNQALKMNGIQRVLSYLFFAMALAGILLISTGTSCVNYTGFAVDKEGNLYLGRKGEISVVSPEGGFLRSISARTGRGYRFTLSDDMLLVDTGDRYYKMDLLGNVLEEGADAAAIRLQNRNRIFTAADGNVYQMKLVFPWKTQILKVDGEQETVIFQNTIADYGAGLLVMIGFVGMLALPAVNVIRQKQVSPVDKPGKNRS